MISNLIFIEHQKLLKLDSLKSNQIDDLQKLNSYYITIDSIQQQRIDSCLKKVDEYNDVVTQLKKKQSKITRWSKIKSWIIGGLGAAVVALIFIR